MRYRVTKRSVWARSYQAESSLRHFCLATCGHINKMPSMNRGVTVCKTSLPSASLQIPFQISCRWRAVCKSADLQYCRRCVWAGNAFLKQLFCRLLLPPIRQGSEFLRKTCHLECWLRQQLSNSFLKAQCHIAWCF
jgi:hypothetical protein